MRHKQPPSPRLIRSSSWHAQSGIWIAKKDTFPQTIGRKLVAEMKKV